LKEYLDTTTPTGKFMLVIFAGVAELERECILQRQREGIIAAKKRGVKFGRVPICLPENYIDVIYKYERGELSEKQARELLNMSSATFYRRLSVYRARIPSNVI
jgi:DNA invertase Pin-like site-specific DNA recombinase